MKEQFKRIAASKRAERARLTALPFAEKLRILGRLRQRMLAIRKSRIKASRP